MTIETARSDPATIFEGIEEIGSAAHILADLTRIARDTLIQGEPGVDSLLIVICGQAQALAGDLDRLVSEPTIHETPSPLRQLYFQWQEAKAASTAADDLEDGHSLIAAIIDVEQKAADFTPHTPEDWAFKIIFADDNGDMDMNIHQVALTARAYEFCRIARSLGT